MGVFVTGYEFSMGVFVTGYEFSVGVFVTGYEFSVGVFVTGYEFSVGVFVSHVEPGSQADKQGLKVGIPPLPGLVFVHLVSAFPSSVCFYTPHFLNLWCSIFCVFLHPPFFKSLVFHLLCVSTPPIF